MSKTTDTLLHLAFIVGYSQDIPARSFRRIVAKTELHRAWLAGNQGCIGEPDGVLYRCWFTNRKNHRHASLTKMWHTLRDYYHLKPSQSLVIAIAADILDKE